MAANPVTFSTTQEEYEGKVVTVEKIQTRAPETEADVVNLYRQVYIRKEQEIYEAVLEGRKNKPWFPVPTLEEFRVTSGPRIAESTIDIILKTLVEHKNKHIQTTAETYKHPGGKTAVDLKTKALDDELTGFINNSLRAVHLEIQSFFISIKNERDAKKSRIDA